MLFSLTLLVVDFGMSLGILRAAQHITDRPPSQQVPTCSDQDSFRCPFDIFLYIVPVFRWLTAGLRDCLAVRQ